MISGLKIFRFIYKIYIFLKNIFIFNNNFNFPPNLCFIFVSYSVNSFIYCML